MNSFGGFQLISGQDYLGFPLRRSVIVFNLNPTVTETSLRILFACAGTIIKVLIGEGVGIIEFESKEVAELALLVNNTEFHGNPLVVKEYNEKTVTPECVNLIEETKVTRPYMFGIPEPGQPPRYPPLTIEQYEEISRTIYVGRINSEVSQQQLIDFFSSCGEVTYCRLAGDGSHPSRFAFIEFATKEGADAAVLLDSTLLCNINIKINRSKNPIVKTPLMLTREEENLRRRFKQAQKLILKRVQDKMRASDPQGEKGNTRENHARSRSRDRERRKKHSRSRSRSRSRDRARRRSHSRSGSRDRRYRKVSSYRRRSRSRSRSRGRDRKRSTRNDSRSRDRKRHRSRSRDLKSNRSSSSKKKKESKSRSRSRSRSRDRKGNPSKKVINERMENPKESKVDETQSTSSSIGEKTTDGFSDTQATAEQQ